MNYLTKKLGRRHLRKLNAVRVAAAAGIETIALASALRQVGRGRAHRATALAGVLLAELARQRHAGRR